MTDAIADAITPAHPPVLVTVVIPCLDEEDYIEDCIRAVQGQLWPADRIEILVADGMSLDATREILGRLQQSVEVRILLIDNPARIQSAGLNECIRRAKGDVIIRMDVHADYAPDFVEKCVATLERTGADNVGGAARPKAKTFFQRCVAAALSSPLGIGGSKYRQADAEGFVESVWPGAFDRRDFERVGLFDPKAVTNEDAELNQRILESGGRVYMSRDIVSHYYPRESIQALAKQYFKYGKGRARTLLLSTRSSRPSGPALPFLGLVGEAFVLVAAPWQLGGVSIAGYAARNRRRGRARGTRRGPRGDSGRLVDLPRAPRIARRRLRPRPREVHRPPRLGDARAPPPAERVTAAIPVAT